MERLKVSVNASLLTLPTARSIFQYPARFLIPSLISHHHPFTGDLGCKGDTDQRRVASNGSFCNQESVAIPVVAHGTSIIQSDVFMSPPSLFPFSPRFFFFLFFFLSLIGCRFFFWNSTVSCYRRKEFSTLRRDWQAKGKEGRKEGRSHVHVFARGRAQLSIKSAKTVMVCVIRVPVIQTTVSLTSLVTSRCRGENFPTLERVTCVMCNVVDTCNVE